MPLLSLAAKSLLNRWPTALLTVCAIGLSVTLLLGVERIRVEAKTSFANTISGTDLVVGARSGAIQLLLYSVFRIGNATNNISWKSYRHFADRPEVAWTIPLSLGDSHRGYRVLGTNGDYFRYLRYSRQRQLAFAAGEPFDDLFEAVLGAEVAATLGYRLGDEIVISHGLGEVGFANHKDKPFRVAGILARTGTPADRTIHISLEAIEAIHVDWRSGSKIRGVTISADEVRRMDLRPKVITAFLVGLKSRLAVFSLQRSINEFPGEPLLAILPGLALQELWGLLGTVETAMAAITFFVVAVGLVCMLIMLMASLNERRREMAILRSIGARPAHVFALYVAEALIVTFVGAISGTALLYVLMLSLRPLIDAWYGINIAVGAPSSHDLSLLGLVMVAGLLAGAFPAWRAYRQSLADGMTVRT